ncbi:molybdopterin-dependent oxidoreductase [Chloroflexota bacterium]
MISNRRKIIRTICQGCHPECGVLVHVEDGKVVKIEGDPEHPMNRGFICVRGRVQHQFAYHPDRLKYPLRRSGEKGGGKWERVTWDQALSGIAEKLTEIKEKYGSESIATCHGTGPRGSSASTRFLGPTLVSPNVVSTDTHICHAPSVVAEVCTLGHSIMMEKGPDYLSANCILICGGNPVVSHPPRGMEVLEAKRKNNAKLIVIDPRRTPLAHQADLWLQIRPGTDLALVLGMINIIINEELYDKEFVSKWCYGFDKLREQVREYSLERVAEITWIPADTIREAARVYATTKPAVLHHRVAVEHNINSTQTNRALAMLIALTGNIDVKGGNLLSSSIDGFMSSGLMRSDKQFKLDAEIDEKRIGSKQFPLISGPEAKSLFVHAGLAIEAMLTGKPYPIKAFYCAGGNPVVNIQGSKRVWEALKNLELYVVADFFMTPSAELADYVLPVAFWLERDECCDIMYMNYIGARQKAIEPLFECWDDMKIVIELAKKVPWAHRRFLPWNDVDEYNEWRVKGMGMTFEEFKEKGYVAAPVKYKKYEEKGFNTPTGKVELHSTIFEKYGHDPLPRFMEPPESPVSTPELIKDYPLILITGGRYPAYYHSDGRQIHQLRKLVPDPEIEIHPDTAKKANIADGDWVWVETPRAKGERVKLKAKLTSSIDPRVVHAAHGWWFPEKPAPEHGCFDSNINVTLSFNPPMEPICGSVPVRGILCRIYKQIS